MLAEIIPKVAAMTFKDDKKFSIRASIAGPQRCIRQMVYHGLGVDRKLMPGRAIIIFSDSSFHEDLTNDWIRKTAYKLHSEQMHLNLDMGLPLPERKCFCGEIIPEGHVAGHNDGIVTDLLEYDRLYEHKAINHFTFQKIWDRTERPLDYFTQEAIYTRALQQDVPELAESILLIKNKNTAQYMEIIASYDNDTDTFQCIEQTDSTGENLKLKFKMEHVVERAANKFSKVLEYIDKKTLPKRQYEVDDWHCSYCQWGGKCYENYEKEFLELKTGEVMAEEAAQVVKYFQEVKGHLSDLTKEKNELSVVIKKMLMDEMEAREAITDEYLVKVNLNKNGVPILNIKKLKP